MNETTIKQAMVVVTKGSKRVATDADHCGFPSVNKKVILSAEYGAHAFDPSTQETETNGSL